MTQYLLRAALLAMLLASFSAHAALITSLSNLNIDGKLYNATFHAGQSFNDLFDADGDLIFTDNDGSLFNRAPQFWGTEATARSAAAAIISRLGTVDHAHINLAGNPSDTFLVPYEHSQPDVGSPIDGVFNYGDIQPNLTNEQLRLINHPLELTPEQFVFVTFKQVPTPTTFALTGLALGIMGFMGRRRRA